MFFLYPLYFVRFSRLKKLVEKDFGAAPDEV